MVLCRHIDGPSNLGSTPGINLSQRSSLVSNQMFHASHAYVWGEGDKDWEGAGGTLGENGPVFSTQPIST